MCKTLSFFYGHISKSFCLLGQNGFDFVFLNNYLVFHVHKYLKQLDSFKPTANIEIFDMRNAILFTLDAINVTRKKALPFNCNIPTQTLQYFIFVFHTNHAIRMVNSAIARTH